MNGAAQIETFDTGSAVVEKRRGIRAGALALALLVICLSGWASGYAYHTAALERIRAETRSALSLIAQGISGEVAKFETLAGVTAGDPRVKAFFRNGRDLAAVNARLVEVKTISKALEAYVIGRDGTTLAASNWNDPATFVGKNFSFRPYFQDALAGGTGRFFALGTTSLQRGYFFSAPIVVDGAVAGVSVVKMGVGALEDVWRRSDRQVLVVDDAGVVFVSTEPHWHYRTTRPLSEERRGEILRTRQYPADSLAPLGLTVAANGTADAPIATLAASTDGPARQVLVSRWEMTDLGWTVLMLSPMQQVDRATMLATGMGGAIATGLLALLWIVYERRMRALGAARMLAQNKRMLERQVADRTRELQATNEELRAMQKIVAINSKFAAIGKLSGGLCHEISQPLTAIDSQLFELRQTLTDGRLTEARDGVGRLTALSNRISGIVQKLKGLARGSRIALDRVPLRRCAEAVLETMASDLEDVAIVLNGDEAGSIGVSAERILLEQVLINVVANARDAVREVADPEIAIGIAVRGDRAELSVRDNGTGFLLGQETESFEPFVTTKSGAGGLGLGLTIAQDAVNRFGGQITAGNNADGPGAVVTISLPLAPETVSLERA
ncbi:MAG: ATP-binding protein [Pseudomonadota bacterium]